MNKLQILQIIRGLDIGGDSGGAEKFGVELSRSLARAGHKVQCCAFFKVGTPTEQQLMEELQREGIDTYFLTDWRGYNNLRQYLRGLWTLLKKLRGSRLDIAQSHFQLGSLTLLILKILRKTRAAVRTAHIRHEWELGKGGWYLNRIFIQNLFPIVLDAEVGVSQAVVDYLKTHPGVRISNRQPVLIHNAVSYETKHDLSLAPERITRLPGEFLIISVGRLTEQKGYEYILKAIPAIHKTIPSARFFFAGEGELKESLQELARALGIDQAVTFMGLRTDVPYLFPQFDLFVLPSLWEGFPTVIMESMVSGVPVVATDIPGTRELVDHGKNGWLVPPRNPESLAAAVVHALTHPMQGKELAAQASQDVRKFFIASVCQEYLDLYQGILRR